MPRFFSAPVLAAALMLGALVAPSSVHADSSADADKILVRVGKLRNSSGSVR